MSDDLARTSLVLARGIELLDADPLAQFRCTSEVQRQFIRNLGRAVEIYLHSCNKGGKSTIGIATDLAICRDEPTLDGIPLPRVPMPARWGLFVPDYKAHRSSTQPIIEALVGNWPHAYERIGQTLVGVRIKPRGWRSDDPSTWSQYTVYSCENPNAGLGARLHGAGADEPPPEHIWREVRKAGEAGTIFPLSIRGTPLKRSTWWWLRNDYPDPHLNEGRIVNGFLRLRQPLVDAHGRSLNEALTERDIATLLQLYENDEFRDARIYGHEINTEGSSPFQRNYAELQRWFDVARTGELREWQVTREVASPEGMKLVREAVEVEVHADYVPGHVYRVIADPSYGIDDGEHDPGAALVVDLTAREDVCAYRGYIGEYGLGVLCAGLGRQYGEAPVDADTSGGYGSAFLGGLRAAGYTKVVTHQPQGSDRAMDRRDMGFVINAATRAEFASALNEALFASAQGSPWLTIRTRWVLADLVDLVLKNDRPVTGSGLHDEGFICAGRGATLLLPDRRPFVAREAPPKRETPREAGMKRLAESVGLPTRRTPGPYQRPRFRVPGR